MRRGAGSRGGYDAEDRVRGALAALALAAGAATAADDSALWPRRRARRLLLARSLCRRQPRLSMGLRSATARPSRPASPAACRAATTGSSDSSCSAPRPICSSSDADDVFAAWKFSNPWFGTLRGRAGVALNNVLLYGTVGLAYGSAAGPEHADRRIGIARPGSAGRSACGLEVAMMGNWSRQSGIPLRRSRRAAPMRSPARATASIQACCALA